MTMSALFRMVCLCPVSSWGLQTFSASGSETRSPVDALWINSQMRSASSTILSMISATADDNRKAGDVFSLFEPCHNGDEYNDRLEKLEPLQNKGCADVVYAVSKCDFSEIFNLWGWDNPHTSNNLTTEYSKSLAETNCKQSKHIAIKTVRPWPLADMSWVLDKNPNLRILEVVRDPRGIFASRLSMSQETEVITEHMLKDCRIFAKNLNFTHPRLSRLVFEELVVSPKTVMQDVYKFLNRDFGQKEETWVAATFDADCTTSETKSHAEGTFQDCHSDSAKSAYKWKEELSDAVKQEFNNYEDCVSVARAYNFEL